MGKWVRHSQLANNDWYIWQSDDGWYGNEQVSHALLMDIRAELRKLNSVMQCPNVGAGFRAMVAMNLRDEKKFKQRVARAVKRELKKRGVKP